MTIDPDEAESAKFSHVVHKHKYEFAEGDNAVKYELFLKEHLHSLDPVFLGIIEYVIINSYDGPMCQLTLTTTLDDPGFDVIAECFINGQYIYLWKDCVWTLGVDTQSKPFRHFFGIDFKEALASAASGEWRNSSGGQRIIIYPIGITPTWMQTP